MAEKMTRSQALDRLKALRDMLDAPDADIAAIEAEIQQLEEVLEEAQEAVEEVAEEAEAAAEPEQRDQEEEPQDEEDAAQDEPEEDEDEEAQRDSFARRRAQLRARVAAGMAGTVRRNFKDLEGKPMNTFGIETKEYRAAWLKNIQGKPMTAQERAAVSASAAIPQETMNKIWGKMELYPLLEAVDVMHVPGTVILPVEGTVNDANVVAMATAAIDSADTLAPVSLGVYKIIKTLEITADVAAMAIDAFENWLVDRLANKVYRKITALIAAGTGSSQPTGLTAISADGHTYTKAAITYADVLAIIAALPAEYAPNAAFVMSRATFYQGILGLEDTHKKPIVVADVQAPAKFNILGYPVIIEDGLGTDIVFGDLKEGYVWNFGKDLTVERDNSVGFRTGSTVFRGMALGDGKPTGVGLVRFTKAA